MSKGKIYSLVSNDILYDQRVRRIASTLGNSGYEVHIIGRKKSSENKSKGQWHLLNCFFKKSKWFYLEFNIRLFIYLLFRKFDWLIANDLDTILAARLISIVKKKKLIFDAHEIFTEVPELVGRDAVKNIWHKIGLWAIPGSALNLTVNTSLKDILSNKYDVEFEVIMNRPVLSKVKDLKNESRQAKRIILYQGAINRGRGIKETIKACESINNVSFLIAGDGDEFETIKKEVENDNSLKEKVRLLGKLTPTELKEITATASIGINVLSGESLNYRFSLANKFFDYAQAGVPSINMNFPEYVNHIKEFKVGICIDDLKTETIANAIKVLLDNKELYKEMIDACKKASQVWTWEAESKKLVKLFDALR